MKLSFSQIYDSLISLTFLDVNLLQLCFFAVSESFVQNVFKMKEKVSKN